MQLVRRPQPRLKQSIKLTQFKQEHVMLADMFPMILSQASPDNKGQ